MSKKFVVHRENYLGNIIYDLPAGLVVFLVAIPLCLGIALASGAPFFSGIIAGILGGLIVPLISQSQLSVSGPAAGLTAIVLVGITDIGDFRGFLVAVFIGGVIQIALGLARAGFIAYYIPSSVIKGMLAAIGIILILKQLPHAIGYDHELFGLAFQEPNDENTFTALLHAFNEIEWGALIISSISIFILVFWNKIPIKNIHIIPAALVVVVLGAVMNSMFSSNFRLSEEHLVNLPLINTMDDFFSGFEFPDWSYLNNSTVWVTGVTIGIVASIESLLTVEAVDKLDPYKRKSPLSRELIAQGAGNTVAGLIGGIPLTSVIVRSSANINSGGRTKMAAFFHGVFLLLSVIFISSYMNLVPLASLAAILLVVGYKLARPDIFKSIYAKGTDQFIPFVITIVAILLTDLLIGVSIGLFVGLIFVIRSNFHTSLTMTRDGDHYLIRLNKDVSFLNKPLVMEALESIEEGGYVIIDGTRAQFIDSDISEVLEEFKQEAKTKSIHVEFKNTSSYAPKRVSQSLILEHSNGKEN